MARLGVPLPAIIFLAVLVFCIGLLVFIYCCLKRKKWDTNDLKEPPIKRDKYTELKEDYYNDEPDGMSNDDDYMVPSVSSKEPSRLSSRRSSYDQQSCRSDYDIGPGESVSMYGYGRQSETEFSSHSGAENQFHSAEDLSSPGRVCFELRHEPSSEKLTVFIQEAEAVTVRSQGGCSVIRIHLTILPSKKQRSKTKLRPSVNPRFNETFVFSKIDHDTMQESSIRLRMYGHEKLSRCRLLGEVVQPLDDTSLSETAPLNKPVWRDFLPKGSQGGSGGELSDTSSVLSYGSGSIHSSMASLGYNHHGAPELLVAIAYANNIGRLTVEILKASNLRNLSSQRAPDTYVKVSLFNSVGNHLAKSKTSLRRSMFDPEFNETFVFQVIEFDLQSVSLMFSIVSVRKMRRKEIIGWFSMGHDNTKEDELVHWREMLSAGGKPVRRWHVLRPVDKSHAE